MDHCVRKQKNKDLPTGVPQRIFSFPEKYGSESYDLHINWRATCWFVMEYVISGGTDDYLSEDFLRSCEMQFVGTDEIEPKEASTAYLHLKEFFLWILVIQ